MEFFEYTDRDLLTMSLANYLTEDLRKIFLTIDSKEGINQGVLVFWLYLSCA